MRTFYKAKEHLIIIQIDVLENYFFLSLSLSFSCYVCVLSPTHSQGHFGNLDIDEVSLETSIFFCGVSKSKLDLLENFTIVELNRFELFMPWNVTLRNEVQGNTSTCVMDYFSHHLKGSNYVIFLLLHLKMTQQVVDDLFLCINILYFILWLSRSGLVDSFRKY